MATLPNPAGYGQGPRPSSGIASYSVERNNAPQILEHAGSEIERASQIIGETNRRQDEVTAQAAINKLKQQALLLERDPDKGFVASRGGAVVGGQFVKNYQDQLNSAAESISSSLTSDYQKQLFKQHQEVVGLQYQSALLQHQAKETARFNVQTREDTVKLAMDDIAAHPYDDTAYEVGMMQVGRAVVDSGKDIGLTGDALANYTRNKLDDIKSKALQSRISAMLTADDVENAQKYFEVNKTDMRPSDSRVIQDSIHQTSVLKSAQTNADQLASSDVPLSQALESTRQKFEGKAREVAMAQVKTRYAERDLAAKQAELSSYETARLHVEQGQRIPLNVWQGMDDGHRADILASQRGRADAMEAKARGREVKTDWPTYLRLRDFAGTDPEKFMAEDLGKYAGYIGGPQLEQLQDMKDRLADPKRQKDAVSLQQQVTAAVNSLKLSGKQGEEKKGQLQTSISNAIFAAEEAKGKPLTAPERQKEIDRLLIPGEVESGSWWKSDPDVRLYEIAGDPTQRAKFAPTITDADRSTIVKRFESRGVKSPTNDQIMQAYKAWKKL